MKRRIYHLTILLLGATLLQAQTFTIDNYNIEITLSEEGHIDVTEIIEVDFHEEMRGIYKKIPKYYFINNKKVRVGLNKIKVKGKKFKRLSEDKIQIIRIGESKKYLTGKHTYQLDYRLTNTFIHETDHISFQYNLISAWEAEIKNLSYVVNLPPELKLSRDNYLIMTGKLNERNKHVTLRYTGNKIIGRSLTAIPANENVTVAVKLPYDFIEKPIPPFSLTAAKKDLTWSFPFLASIFMFIFYRSRLSEKPFDTIDDEYYPPENFSPALVGAYYDHKIQTEDIISLLPYWAGLGYISMLKGQDVLFFKKLLPLPKQAPSYQKTLFEGIFSNGDMVMLSDLKEKISGSLAKAKSQIKQQIINRALYDQDNYRIFHSGKLLFIGMISLAAAMFCFSMTKIITGIAFVILASLLFIIHSSRPKLSQHGLALKKHLKGLYRFLEKGDPQVTAKQVKENPQYFEQLYPYAIALGIDKTWTQRMAEADIPSPSWYSYENNFRHQTSPSFKSFSQEFDIPKIKSVFTSVPPTNSGSNRSGGFSRSGGAGGGFGSGGGAW